MVIPPWDIPLQRAGCNTCVGLTPRSNVEEANHAVWAVEADSARAGARYEPPRPPTDPALTLDAQLSALSARLEDSHWWFTARAQIVAAIGTHLLPESARLVEVGCGTGNLLAAFPDDWHRVGVDVSSEAIAIAQARHSGRGLHLVAGSAPDAVREELRAADLVLFCDVLEHIDDEVTVFRSVVEELSPGTRILITVPAGMELWSPHDVSHGHFRRYDRAGLAKLWEGQPLLTHLLSPFNYRLYPLVRLVREVSARTSFTLGPANTDLALPAKPLNWMLRRTFLSELGPLLRALDSEAPPVRRRGVSWLAVLERR